MPRWSNATRSKEKLFAEVIERAFDIRYLIDGDRGNPRRTHLARTVVYGREDIGGRSTHTLLLICAPPRNPTRPELIRASLERNVLRPIAERLDGLDAEVGPRWSLPSARGLRS